MIAQSVSYLKDKGREVIYDAEHFFDGLKADAGFTLYTEERLEGQVPTG